MNEFAIIGMPRSGTTVLSEFINSDPGITVCKEIFHPSANEWESFEHFTNIESKDCSYDDTSKYKSENYGRFIEYLRNHTGSNIIGVNIKYASCHSLNEVWQNLSSPPALFDILDRRRSGIIHVVRHDSFDVAISNMLASRTGVWHVGAQEDFSRQKIVGDIEYIQYIIQLHRKEMLAFEEISRIYPKIIKIDYEEMFEGESFSHALGQRISGFLDRKCNFNYMAKLKKIVPDDLSKVFSNWEEIVALR